MHHTPCLNSIECISLLHAHLAAACSVAAALRPDEHRILLQIRITLIRLLNTKLFLELVKCYDLVGLHARAIGR